MTQANGNDEINLAPLVKSLKRNWRVCAKVAVGSLIFSTFYAFIQPQVWKGEFQIVLSNESSSAGALSQLASIDPILAKFAGGKVDTSKKLETEIRVLESPSVLKPVFDYALEKKRKAGQNVEGLRFSDWVRNVTVALDKGTTVLNISYLDTDKKLVLPVISKISQEYQDYSDRARRRDIANAVDYLEKTIKTLSPKAESSMKAAQSYALSQGLGINDGMPVATSAAGGSAAVSSVEASRQEALTKVLLLEEQLKNAKASGSNVVFQAPQYDANSELYSRYQLLEARLSDLRSRLKDNDQLVRNLLQQRQSLIRTLNQQTIGLIEGELASAKAAMASSTRPKEVVLKHRELVRQALRDEKTLAALENQLQLAQLEQAKQGDPWELISKPSLLDAPVAPRKLRIMALGLALGLVAGAGTALMVDRRSGRIFSEDELLHVVPGPLLVHLEPPAMEGKLTLLARGPLSGSHLVGLIPVGLQPNSTQFKQVIDKLKEQLPHTQIICSRDLVEAASCDHQLLITRLGAARRTELANLRQQLNLQGRPITAWLLLDDQVRAA